MLFICLYYILINFNARTSPARYRRFYELDLNTHTHLYVYRRVYMVMSRVLRVKQSDDADVCSKNQ